jgi:hypothetical protein
MHPTTLSILADDKIAEYRREADEQRLASEAHRAPRLAPIISDQRPTIAPRTMQASEADC